MYVRIGHNKLTNTDYQVIDELEFVMWGSPIERAIEDSWEGEMLTCPYSMEYKA